MAGTIGGGVGGGPGSTSVSMESGLDGRNNAPSGTHPSRAAVSLNGVRPRWPEQFSTAFSGAWAAIPSQWSPA